MIIIVFKHFTTTNVLVHCIEIICVCECIGEDNSFRHGCRAHAGYIILCIFHLEQFLLLVSTILVYQDYELQIKALRFS